ncbi:hypothetical protein [Candidatus Binatus sp.]|uniref:hypothetical protein n=1 Tax=Candidatus Binatus sp. TaxID=2811406 RepID=UPI003C988DED
MNRIAPKTPSFAARTAALLFVFTVGVALATSGSAWAKKAKSVPAAISTVSISACSATALTGTNTIYLVTQNLTEATASATCITLGGTGNTLALQGFDITGPGTVADLGTPMCAFAGSTGDGIHIETSANEDVIEGGGGEVSGFAVGVLDQGNNTAGDDVLTLGNGVGLKMNGGSEATELWTNLDSSENSMQGIFVASCGDECGAADFFTGNNCADGVLVTGSAGPRLNVFLSVDNGGAGVHIGCTSGCGTNSSVKVGDAPEGETGGTSPAVTGNAGDGIFLDASEASTGDRVFLINTSGNHTTSGYDLHDASSTCGANHWVTNTFNPPTGTARAGTVSSPACIPNTTF